MGSYQNAYEITGYLSDKKSSNYHMVISAGFLPNGKRNRVSITTGISIKGNNFRKASKMLNELIRDLCLTYEMTAEIELKKLHNYLLNGIEGTDCQKNLSETEVEKIRFSDVIDEWLLYYGSIVKGNTLDKYKYASKHIKKFFSDTNVTEITPRMIANYYTEKLSGAPGKNIKPLTAKTLKDHKSAIYLSLAYAKDIMGIITENPSENVRSPKVIEKIPDFFREKELNEIFSLVMAEPIAPAVIFAGAFGLRRQEAVGMKWNAVDFKHDSITVCHTVTKIGNIEVEADTTKSYYSYRTLKLLEDMKPYLVMLKNYQKSRCKEIGFKFSEDNYICTWPDGKRLRADYVTSKWRKFLKEIEMRHIKFHNLRHSSASLLLRSGLSLVEVKDWLGHADIETTAKYAHICAEERQQRIAEKLKGKLIIPADQLKENFMIPVA